MIGVDDQVAVIGDWVPPNPSPRTFLSSILADDFGSRSFSELLGGHEHEGGLPLDSSEKHKELEVNGGEEGGGAAGNNGVSDDQNSDSSTFSSQKQSPRRSLTERMAARAGFNAPTLNTNQVSSPYLTIPPGLSPTSLLDSPVFLSNSLVQPSPTTGKFSCDPSQNKNSMFASDKDKDNQFENVNTSAFAFKPHVELNPSHFYGVSDKENPARNTKQQFPSMEVSVQSEHSLQLQSRKAAEEQSHHNHKTFHPWADLCRSTMDRNVDPIASTGEGSPQLDDQQDGEGDQTSNGELNTTISNAASSEDGYNWRKYGQKQVKGSECPRSYYKCTHPNCQVKKKVERSHEGHITEIIYKGAHNHPKPPPSRRSTINAQNDLQLEIPEHATTQGGIDGDRVWASYGGTATGCPDRKHDNMEVTSSASVGLELCDPSLSMHTERRPHFEAASAVDVSSNQSNDEDEDDRGTHGSVSLGGDGEGDETESKRRKIEVTEMSGVSRAIREPRVVVQTTSEVDILDDGYRWRKYGQKVVKGNPNPRSYYKCTNPGCTVRKHVERASHDLKSVITTYEGKHNHDVPAARSNSHANSGNSNAVAAIAAQSRTHRPAEPYQAHDNMARFDGSMSLGRQQPRTLPGFSFGMNHHPGLANLSMAGQNELPPLPVYLRQYFGQQQQQQGQVNEMGSFMTPKGEPKYEPVSEHGLNGSNAPMVYHQMMNRLPLGPQS